MKKHGFLKFLLICASVAAFAFAVVKILSKMKERLAEGDDECDCDGEEIGCTGCCDECELCDEDDDADDEVAFVEGADKE